MQEDLDGQTAECQRLRGDLSALEQQHRHLMETVQRERERAAEVQQQWQQAIDQDTGKLHLQPTGDTQLSHRLTRRDGETLGSRLSRPLVERWLMLSSSKLAAQKQLQGLTLSPSMGCLSLLALSVTIH